MMEPNINNSATGNPEPNKQPIHVAIIGAGITGLALALGLQQRGVSFTVYERTSTFQEIGAGIAISSNAETALEKLNPKAHQAFRNVANPNGEDYFQWVDGHGSDQIVYRLHVGEGKFNGCRRSDFSVEMGKAVPKDRVLFDKQLETFHPLDDGRVRLQFKDGMVERADVVIGCDGIRSRVRQLILGTDNPAANPGYTHRFCFRALVPIADARAALGDHRVSTRFMYNGPGAHLMTYPVAMDTFLNVLAVVADPKPWSATAPDGRHTAKGTKAEAVEPFQDWHPTTRKLVNLLPDELDKWAIFDMLDNPADTYTKGNTCLAGDAAHAAGPHLGSGAGFGIEDALVLSSLLEEVNNAVHKDVGSSEARTRLIQDALQTYSDVRYDRTQWLIGATRDACDLFQWRYPDVGSDPEKFAKEITKRFYNIWHQDIDEMVQRPIALLQRKASDQ